MNANGRTILLVLFFWAVLAIVTPTLVRWSASAKPYMEFHGEGTEGTNGRRVLELLSRRALAPARLIQAPFSPLAPGPRPAPAPAPAPTPPEPLL